MSSRKGDLELSPQIIIGLVLALIILYFLFRFGGRILDALFK